MSTYDDLPPEEFKKKVMEMIDFFDRMDDRMADPNDVDLRSYPPAASAMCLARRAVDCNAGSYRVLLGGYTIEDKDQGDWEVIVRKVTPFWRFMYRIKDWIEEIKTFHYKKVYGVNVDDILSMKQLDKLTMVIKQPENKRPK